MPLVGVSASGGEVVKIVVARTVAVKVVVKVVVKDDLELEGGIGRLGLVEGGV